MTLGIVDVAVPLYLDYMGIGGMVRTLLMQNFFFLQFELMLSPLYDLICHMIYTDGDEFIGMCADIARPLLNIILSILLGRRLGIQGIGIGTLASTLAGFLILAVHFLKSRNTLHPRFYFSMADLKQMILLGGNDSAMFFLLPMLFFIITKCMMLQAGEHYIPLLVVLYAVLELTSVFEATGEAMRPILPIYLGDKNIPAVLRLADHS